MYKKCSLCYTKLSITIYGHNKSYLQKKIICIFSKYTLYVIWIVSENADYIWDIILKTYISSSKHATFAAKLINIMAKNNLMESGLTSDLLLIIKNIYDNINVCTTCVVDRNASIIMIKNTWTINRERLQREKEQQKCDALE